MAVYTEVPRDELERHVAAFGLGRLRDVVGIQEGVENSNFRLETEHGRYILTLYEKRTKREDLPFFLGLMDHLAARGVVCPLPVHAPDGRVLGELAGRPAAIVTFLNGAWPRQPTAVHCAGVGRALAVMHRAGEGFALRRTNALGPDGWSDLFARFAHDADAIAPGMRTAIADELALLGAVWPRDLPAGVIHADLFPDNVFFVGDEVSGLIDFYFACNDLYAYDVAVCLNAWCFDAGHTYDVAKGRALLAAYESVRPLTLHERVSMPTLCRGAALRFLLTRAHDWIHTPADALVQRKDPLEYLAKLRFHQAIADTCAYGFTP
jgi:homoserine kinase type II